MLQHGLGTWLLLIIATLGGWVALNRWVLPRLGIKT